MAFKKCDSDNEKGLTWEEVSACSKEAAVTKAAFEIADSDRDGILLFKEWEKYFNQEWETLSMKFKTCNSDTEPGLTWEEVVACEMNALKKADFDKFNLNGDETLDFEKLEKYLEMNSS